MQREKFPSIEEYDGMEIALLANRWKSVYLEDVATISSGGSAPQGKRYFNGKYPFIRVQHIDNRSHRIDRYDLINEDAVSKYKLKLYRKGAIVFPKSGASVYLEKRAILPVDAYIVSHLCAVLPNKSIILHNFLYYVLTHLKLAKKKADGYPTLNLSEIKKTIIPLPPLSEQKKIAYVLSTIQQAREKTEQAINATKELKKSLMKHLFRYGPVSLEKAENVKLKETEIREIPEEWEILPANKVFSHITDGTHDTPKKLSIGIPLIKSKQIKNGAVDKTSIDYYISKDDYILINQRSKVDKFDLLYSMIGTIGEVALIREEPYFSIKNVGLFKSNSNSELAIYCFYWFQSENARHYALKNASGTSQKYITLAKLRNYPIVLPNKPVRTKIASILSAVDEKIEKLENRRKALEELFRSMLHNLMTAKIRVKDLEIGDA